MKMFVSPISFLVGLTIVMLLIIYMDSIEISTKRGIFLQESRPSFLLNMPGFEYVINNHACANFSTSNPLAIMIVTSHAGNVATRKAHRESLPKELLLSIGIQRVFLLALASEDSKDQHYKSIKQQEVINESIVNHDLIQGNFNEAYRNLTYKHVMGLHWVSQYCEAVKYVIKMDDDIILDVFQLIRTLPGIVDPNSLFIMGYLLKGMKPIREPKNKWFVSQREYPKAYYPPFVSGWMYVTTPGVVSKIVQSTQRHKNRSELDVTYQSFFWIDDVFITGILSRLVGAKLIDISKYFAVHPQYLQCCIEAAVIDRAHKQLGEGGSRSCEFIAGPSGGDMELLLKFVEEAKNCWASGKLCSRSTNSSNMKSMCIVGRGEAYDWVRRPFRNGEAILKPIKL